MRGALGKEVKLQYPTSPKNTSTGYPCNYDSFLAVLVMARASLCVVPALHTILTVYGSTLHSRLYERLGVSVD